MSSIKVCRLDLRTQNDVDLALRGFVTEVLKSPRNDDTVEEMLSIICGMLSTQTGRRCWWDNRATKDNPLQEMYTIFFDEGVDEQLRVSLKEVREFLEIPFDKKVLTDEDKLKVIGLLDKLVEAKGAESDAH